MGGYEVDEGAEGLDVGRACHLAEYSRLLLWNVTSAAYLECNESYLVVQGSSVNAYSHEYVTCTTEMSTTQPTGLLARVGQASVNALLLRIVW